jgi:hypothetical protein
MAQILRYPYEALTDTTDYLQVDIKEYTPVQQSSGSLASGGTIRRFENFENVKETTTERLSNSRLESGIGSILLPIPSNIQDGNSVDFAAGNLDGLTAQIYGGVVKGITTPLPTKLSDVSAFF